LAGFDPHYIQIGQGRFLHLESLAFDLGDALKDEGFEG
jgi:hypothetical protein